MKRCTELFLTLHTGAGITSKRVAVRGDNSKYQKKTRLSLRPLLEFALLAD